MSYRKWTFRVGALLGIIGVCGLGVVAGVAWSQAERQRTFRKQPLSQTPGSYAGYPLSSVSANQATTVTWWVKPQGEEPGWLSRGKQAMKAEETLREALNKDVSVDIVNAELLAALEVILGEHKIPYRANPGGMDATLVSLNAQGSLRDVLRRLLRPMQLDYVIHRDSVQIVNPREDSFDRLQSKTGLPGASNQTVDYSSVYRAGLVPATPPPSMQPGYGAPVILPGSQLKLTPRRAEKENTPSENSSPLSPRDPNGSESP